MAINMALKRFKKAQRRKQQVAEKRKAEALGGSLPMRVRKAAQAPIACCLLTASLFEGGMGTLTLARGHGHFAVGSFLLDVWCLGIKDVMFKSVDADALDVMVAALGASAPTETVDPSYARKLLRELAAWSQSIGFAPPVDFALVEALFGDVDANASDATFQFGHEGKPYYIPGPSESPALIQRRIEQLRRNLGDDGFALEHAA